MKDTLKRVPVFFPFCVYIYVHTHMYIHVHMCMNLHTYMKYLEWGTLDERSLETCALVPSIGTAPHLSRVTHVSRFINVIMYLHQQFKVLMSHVLIRRPRMD